MKRAGKIVLWTGGAIVLFAGILTLIGIIYSKDVKQFMVNELNKRFNTPVNVSSLDFTIWKKFPSASVMLTDVVVPGSWGYESDLDADTLLSARELFLSMSLLDLIRKDFKVSSVSCTDGAVKILYNQKGDGNYHVFKTSGDTASVALQLESVSLSDMRLIYASSENNDNISTYIKSAGAKGNLSDARFILDADIDGTVNNMQLAGVSYPLEGKPVVINGSLDVDNTTSLLAFKKVGLRLGGMDFSVEGTMETGTMKSADLKFGGRDLDIRSFLSMLPERYLGIAQQYSSDGEFYFDAVLRGPLGFKFTPLFEADFGITKGNVRYANASPLRNINLKGLFTNQGLTGAEFMKLVVEDFSAVMDHSSFSGSITMENFISPLINIETISTIDLTDLTELLPKDSLPAMKGQAKIDARFKGRIKDPSNYTSDDFRKSRTAGSVDFINVDVIPSEGNAFNEMNGTFLFDNNDVIVKELRGLIGHSDFYIKGFFRNIISSFFVKEEKMVIDAVFKSHILDIDDLVKDNHSGGETYFNLNFSDHAALYLQAEADSVYYQSFKGGNVKAKVIIRDRKMISENLKLNAFDGALALTGIINAGDPGNILISCDLDARNVNMNRLFAECRNFGQETMRSDHIRGKADIVLNFTAVTDTTLILRQDKIETLADIEIRNGELIDFEPLKKMSRFIDVEELSHIKFGRLSNRIEISKRKIIIPVMHIASTALNLDISGWHTFDNEIDYRFRILLSELVASKARKSKSENEEFATYEEEEGKRKTALYIAMKGTVDNPKFTYDRKGVTGKVKSDISNEKSTVKSLLNKEFGAYSKDSALRKEESAPVKFQIEWEEEKKKDGPKEDPSRFEKKKEGRLKKWMNNLPGETIDQ